MHPISDTSIQQANPSTAEIWITGKPMVVPSARLGGHTIIVTGKWPRMASILKEEHSAKDALDDPGEVIAAMRAGKLKADIFTFSQQLPDTEPKYKYYFERDNVAAIPITSFEHWFQERIGTDVKQNVKKSEKRGVIVRRTQLNDEFVRGISEIFNETPVRQGRHFWHYGQSFDSVKTETSHGLERSYFLGAYHNDELIGFIKLLRTGNVADIVLIVCKERHRDKKPTNALLARAVELCVEEGVPFLTYAQFFYFRKSSSSLGEFKRRNGFEPIFFPRYYVPLTIRGWLALKLKLHHGVTGLIPEWALEFLRRVRARFYGRAASA